MDLVLQFLGYILLMGEAVEILTKYEWVVLFSFLQMSLIDIEGVVLIHVV